MKLMSVATILFWGVFSFKAKAENDRPDLTYAKEAFKQYSLILDEVTKLSQTINRFAKQVDEKNYLAVKEAYIHARLVYGPSEVYRFYEGPIDSEKDGVEILVNSWPLDEMYIDGNGAPQTMGIINNVKKYPVINEKLLTQLNMKESDKNIATGFHAVEFLLWGPDRNLDSAGKNTVAYFQDAKWGKRRLSYLSTLGHMLVKHIQHVVDAWNPESKKANYYQTWIKTPVKTNLALMLRGMILLASEEMAGQRMFAAVDSGDQEHEHSCFSDLTHVDLMGNFLGIRNIWKAEIAFPQYTPPHPTETFNILPLKTIPVEDGSYPSLRTYAKQLFPQSVEKIDGLFDVTEQSFKKVPIPFDQAILTGKSPILETIKNLKELANALDKLNVELGIEAVFPSK